ncbi:MAG: dipeptidase [Bryobacteraceae bacterium]|nr:dipeptidase [Bryobacteraceae bacterium]MDW8379134.1 membrane dipeptidase [Bryobacterales bacterium]
MKLLFFLVANFVLCAQDARKLHRDALVFDAHLHMINRQFYHGGDIGDRVADGQVDLVRAREGGLDAMFFTLYVTEHYYPPRYETKQALRLMDLALSQIEKNRSLVGLALNASDVVRLNREGKIAAMLDLEGGFDLDGDLAVLRSLYRMGLRVVQLPAHNWANHFAESCCAQGAVKGLNEHGRAVVREMNRLGMVINVSHASDATIEQVLEISTDPVMATHHGLRSFNDIPRTMPENLLRKLAAKGGVMGFHLGCEFHSRRFFDYRTQRAGKPFWDTREIGKKEAQLTIFEIDRLVAPLFPSVGIPAPEEIKLSLDEWFKVVDRAIEIAGEDHVALGTDLDGGPTLPRGMRDIRDLPLLTEAMLKRGYSEKRIRKFLGENTLRLVRQVTEKRR